MFSRRAQWSAPTNRLTLATEARRERGDEILDLTASNPTTAGFDYPLDALAEAFARAARAPYVPDPLGLPSAREAVARHLGCDATDVVITASTSEAYSYLFKLLADPGDAVLTATPSYPLFEHLAMLETVELRSFPLEFHGRWVVEPGPLRQAVKAGARALVVVNPNNPTGSFVSDVEQALLREQGLPIISDEVFLDYALEREGQSMVSDDVLTFALGGLSKSAGLPHLKLGWIRVSGPCREKEGALAGLGWIADNFLSVGTPVQAALPDLLQIAPVIREQIRARTRRNLDDLRRAIANAHGSAVLPVEGGWSAVIRVPRIVGDEELALDLLSRGVLVHPGYFFDFDREGFLVVSLLAQEETFTRAVSRLAETLAGG